MFQCIESSENVAEWRQDPRAIHSSVSWEISSISPKASPTASDLVLIEDAAASFAKKKATLGTLPYGRQPSAIHDNVAGEIAAITEKTALVAADKMLIEDSEAADAKKMIQVGNLPPGDEVSNLWFPPASPHSEDDEFDSTTLDSAWDAYNFSTAAYESLITGLDTYDGSYSGDDIRYALDANGRKSWLLLQGDDAVGLAVVKDITFPTNLLIWARLKFNQYYSAMTALDRLFGLMVYADSSGDPDINNYVAAYLNHSDVANVVYGKFRTIVSGSSTMTNTTTDVDAQGQALEYVAIHKIGTTYHGYVGTAGGNWIWMGSNTWSLTPAYVGFFLSGATTTLPGLGVVGVDFIRFLETDNFLF